MVEGAEDESTLEEQLLKCGNLPIPPYIRGGQSDSLDSEQYQTVFAESLGSLAAPTAGLHFTEKLLNELESQGIGHTSITLHVGPASFLPQRGFAKTELGKQKEKLLSSGYIAETFFVSNDSREAIYKAKQRGGRIVAVGTTSVRALESIAVAENDYFNNGQVLEAETVFSSPASADELDLRISLQPDKSGISGDTNLIIAPGYQFRVVDSILTNFSSGRSHRTCCLLPLLLAKKAPRRFINTVCIKATAF